MTLRMAADRLLDALATADLGRVVEGCAKDVVLFGTDADEDWRDRAGLLRALEPLASAGMTAEWEGDPVLGEDWVAGTAIYTLPDGSRVPVRISMVFADGLLVHGHFSVAVPEKLVPE